MPRITVRLLVAGAALVVAVGVGACAGNDDGAGVRNGVGDASASGVVSGSEVSGSGLSPADVQGGGKGNDDPLVRTATDEYRLYVQSQAAQLRTDAKRFTDAVRAGDVAAAQGAYAPSRQAWERIEPIAGLIPDLDRKLDARVDDFPNADDPAWTGWHRLEYLLWEKGTTAGAVPVADQLDADLAALQQQLNTVEITPLAVAKGGAELIEEVSQGKIQGEEDRYSRTDLWDFAANVDGSRQVLTLLTPALEAKDAGLLAMLKDQFATVDAGLAPYRDGARWKPYTALGDADRQALAADLAALSESLAKVPGALELQ